MACIARPNKVPLISDLALVTNKFDTSECIKEKDQGSFLFLLSLLTVAWILKKISGDGKDFSQRNETSVSILSICSPKCLASALLGEQGIPGNSMREDWKSAEGWGNQHNYLLQLSAGSNPIHAWQQYTTREDNVTSALLSICLTDTDKSRTCSRHFNTCSLVAAIQQQD